MNNEPNKPRELTEKELEGIVGGESMSGELLRQGSAQRVMEGPETKPSQLKSARRE